MWGTLGLAPGAGGAPSGSRHLLPYFHVDLWPRHGRLPPASESPALPVSSPPSTPHRPSAPLRRPQRGVCCQLPAEGIGVYGARGHAGGYSTFLVALLGGAPGVGVGGRQDGGGKTVWGRLGPPAARGPGARSAMLGEGKTRRQSWLWQRLGAPPATRA